jgi:hypothetical protein
VKFEETIQRAQGKMDMGIVDLDPDVEDDIK